ncbi:hypothetical protein V2J09_002540 [Rumex salicifolius]
MTPHPPSTDSRSGFCSANSTFYSKRSPIPLPSNPNLDLTAFISSHSHHGTTAFIDASSGRRLSYSDLWFAVEAVSSALSSQFGVRKGHVILILSPNSIFFPVVCLSVMSLGAVITTTNALNTPNEIAKQIGDSKPYLAFTTPELLPKIRNAALNLPIILMTDVKNPRSGAGFEDFTTLKELMETKPNECRLKERVTQNDTASLLYSSGTTGPSKGVVSSHGNLIAMVQTTVQRFKMDGQDRPQTFICTVPMFHIYGMSVFATGLLATGATIVVLSKFEIHDLFTAISKYKVSYFPLVPPILVTMVRNAAEIKRRYDVGSLKYVLSGGAPLGKEVIEGFAEKFPGVVVMQGYGMTETVAIGASTDSMEESQRYGTAGKLSPSVEAKIVDPESGGALGVNQTGELWLRGPTVMKGYLCNPEATVISLNSEGWLRTGDICYIDEEGYVFVVDRLKELIKYKGYQVPPAELEALLLTHPQIVDAAAIPVPDKEVGQYPMAYVVRRPDISGNSLTSEAVMEFVAQQVAPYKRIRKVTFIDSIPKNASGKILRRDLIKLQLSTSSL